MSGGKHTPGDWYVCPGKPPADCDDPLCTGIYTDFYDLHGKAHAQGVLHPDGRRITAEQARANAVLMAAAPDLLAALTAITDSYEGLLQSDFTGVDGQGLNTEGFEAVRRAREVIAKATGEAS